MVDKVIAARAPGDVPALTRRRSGTFARLARYALVRAITIALMVVLGVFLAVVFLNLGGFIDMIYRANIDDALRGYANSLAADNTPPEDIPALMKQAEEQMIEAYGLNKPFLSRCVAWTYQALTLDWGASSTVQRLTGPTWVRDEVRGIILDRLPYTLILAGTSNLIVFIASLLLALSLARRAGSRLDRLFGVLSLLSSIPSWIFGLILVLIFSQHLGLLPSSGVLDEVSSWDFRQQWALVRGSMTTLQFVLNVLKHMILPATAIFLGSFFASVYAWRTMFTIHAEEDYVELARARGLPPRMLERRYLLRPTLPAILTSLVVMLTTFWEGTLALEYFFDWPGIGMLFLQAVRYTDRAIGMGIIVIFAFLLAVTIFLLDFAYALADPRVRIGGGEQKVKAARMRRRSGPRRSPALSAPGARLFSGP